MKKTITVGALTASITLVSCATAMPNGEYITEISPVHTGEMGFPELADAKIKGAPKLSQPMLVMGATKPIQTAKHGLAAPALWDWDGDGKRDLLVGEFETGERSLKEKGSTLRVYRNIGTDSAPRFNDTFEYARDTDGNVMVVFQWCCIGFTPFFVDLNNDGYQDMITGQYHPGEVTWYRGSKDGFLPGIFLEQEGNPADQRDAMMGDDIEPGAIGSFGYWAYSSASFGDFDNDGDYDLIVGGNSLRISENIGTPESPKFAERKPLLDIHGQPLKTAILSEQQIAEYRDYGAEPSASGSGKTQQVVTDWDGDGVLDILSTDEYIAPSSRAVSFFRGVKTSQGHRFEPGIELLPTVNGVKALPGSGNRLYVDDWNRDGVKDLIVGASVATVNDGEFSSELSWQWESVNGVQSAGKDPGRHPQAIPERPTRESLAGDRLPGDSDEEFEEMVKGSVDYWDHSYSKMVAENKQHWMTMRHQGRVYVFLGQKPDTKAVVANAETGSTAKKKRSKSKRTPPVQFSVLPIATVQHDASTNLTVNIDVKKGWYIYAPTGRNEPLGMAETVVTFDLPQGFELAGALKLPPHHRKGSFEIYDGEGVHISQPIKVGSAVAAGEYTIKGQARYQTCNREMCLPPKTIKFETTVVVK